MKKITQEELNVIIEKHQEWLKNSANGEYADLSNTDLSDTDLRYANLSFANLNFANLKDAYLKNAILSNVTLINTNLNNANLSFADLSNADLRYADLKDADLRYANLSNSNLRFTDLSGTNLSNADGIYLICPEEGSFIGFKKIYDYKNHLLCKLKIPEDAKRSNGTGRKCRCSKAEVIEILKRDKDGNFSVPVKEGYSGYDDTFKYVVGETVIPDSFEENRLIECTNGIHFLLQNKKR